MLECHQFKEYNNLRLEDNYSHIVLHAVVCMVNTVVGFQN
jgi:hypothetical protein